MPTFNFSKAISGAIGGGLKSTPVVGAALGFASGLTGATGATPRTGGRHRRKGLTKSMKDDLAYITTTLGKKAAHDYLVTHE